MSDVSTRFVFQPVSNWHSALSTLGSPIDDIPAPKLSALSEKARLLHETDIRFFQSSSQAGTASSEATFLSKFIQSGTLSDRLSALTLLVQSSPLHNVKALDSLKSMAERGKGKGGREESLKALRCIVDWWVGGGAPDRKLKYFRDQPLLHPDITDSHLLLWYFEDWLKKYFFSVLQILEILSLDPLPYIRTQTLSLIFTLLRDKPEQEQNLLRLLVNKLGDAEKSLCSRASYHILQLLQTHPSMKSVIVREIMALALKPPVAPSALPSASKKKRGSGEKDKKRGNAHARYYPAVTFNQIVLTPSDKSVAVTLLDVYFQMFKEILGEKDEGGKVDGEKEDGSDDGGDAEVKMDKKGRVLKKEKRKVVNQSKGAAGFMEVEDSDSKLISAILTGINRALPFANIDADNHVISNHIDTLFFITHTSTFNISLQALLLIQQIAASLSPIKKSPHSSPMAKSITDRYYRALYASLHDPRLASSSKQAMYLNLLFKSVKADENNERVVALIRRFTQVLVTGGGGAPEFIAGGLYLLGELLSSIPGLKVVLSPPRPKDPMDRGTQYEPRKRDPQYAHAESSPLWELIPLLRHYHPAVALHAHQLLNSQALTASPDLSQNTLSHFLDRFVYKNPKKLKAKEGDADGTWMGKGPSAMQPAASGLEGVKLIKGEVGYGGEVVNETAFLRRKRDNVPVDLVFFHDYFTRKHRKEKGSKKKVDKRVNSDQEDDGGRARESGDESADTDADEAEIWKVMKSSIPKMDEDDELMDDSDEEGEDMMFDESGGSSADDGSAESGGLSLAEASDDEDLVPLGLIEYDDDEEEEEGEEAWGGIGISSDGKRKRKEEEERGGKRRKQRKSLPTFASFEDYAKLIEED